MKMNHLRNFRPRSIASPSHGDDPPLPLSCNQFSQIPHSMSRFFPIPCGHITGRHPSYGRIENICSDSHAITTLFHQQEIRGLKKGRSMRHLKKIDLCRCGGHEFKRHYNSIKTLICANAKDCGRFYFVQCFRRLVRGRARQLSAWTWSIMMSSTTSRV